MNKSANTFPDAPRPAGSLLAARLHLLDRQLLDANADPVGIVDGVELDGVEAGVDIPANAPAPQVVSILTGQVLFTRMFGGRPPRTRLQELPWHLVTKVGTAVQLACDAGSLDSLWVDHWLREHIISRIPGGQHAAE